MADHKDFISAYGLVPHDRFDLLDLPLDFRWEITRRHPYDLLLSRARLVLTVEMSSQWEVAKWKTDWPRCTCWA